MDLTDIRTIFRNSLTFFLRSIFSFFLFVTDDFENYFGINFESILGYRCWEQTIKPMMTNCMVNISTKTLDGGCVLYYMDVDAAIRKLEQSEYFSENMTLVCEELNIDVEKLKEMRNASLRSSSNTRYDAQRKKNSLKNIY